MKKQEQKETLPLERFNLETKNLKNEISSNKCNYEAESEVLCAKIESISKLRAEQEENLGACRSELEMLIAAYDRSKKDSSRKVASLQKELEEMETHHKNEATKYINDYAKL